MGITKSELFSPQQNRLAGMMKTLAHPARIATIQNLVKSSARICGKLVDKLGLAQATISQHLKELNNVGLIKGTIEGTSVCYCIDKNIWDVYRTFFSGLFEEYINRDECC